MKAYREAVTGLTTAVGGLQTELTRVFEDSAPDTTRLNALGNIAAQVGSLYLEQRRADALKSIVISMDPVIQGAVTVLSDAEDGIILGEQARVFEEAEDTRRVLSEAIKKNASTSRIRAAQDAVFDAHGKFLSVVRRPKTAPAVGAAHAALANLANGNPGLSDLNSALGSLVAATNSIDASLREL